MAYPHLYPGPPFVRQIPYHVSYHPPYYHPFPPTFDPSVSLANPYIYDPTQVKHRRRTTPEQLKVLEDTFKTDPKPSPALRRQLSAQLGMSPRVLQVWFQNRRMKVKRLAKKQTSASADHRQGSADDDDSADIDQPDATPDSAGTSSTSPITDPNAPLASDQGADTPSNPDSSLSPSSSRPSPPPDLAHRRISLPDTRSISPTTPAAAIAAASTATTAAAARASVPTAAMATATTTTTTTSSATSFDALVDPGLKPSRSLASLQRLETHPSISLIASHHSPDRTGFAPIVPPSLPPSFRSLHHHSPSTPLTRISSSLSPMSHRPASFHVIPQEQHQHLSPAATPFPPPSVASALLLHQPYAFPPRPVPVPGPGPLPAADYSFGSPAYMGVGGGGGDGDGDDATSSEYTDHGYRSRFGSFASVVESEEGTTASEWSVAAAATAGTHGSVDADAARRPSWTGEVAELLSGLEVSGSGAPERVVSGAGAGAAAAASANHAMWEAAFGKGQTSGGSPDDETTPPAATFEHQHQHQPHPHQRPSLPMSQISQTSELAFALAGAAQDKTVSGSPATTTTTTQYSSHPHAHSHSPASVQGPHYPSPVRTQPQRQQQPQGSASSSQYSPSVPTQATAVQPTPGLGIVSSCHGNANHIGLGGAGADDLLELHHAMARYADHPSVAVDGSLYFSVPGDGMTAAATGATAYGHHHHHPSVYGF